jgi:hypothetical protein
VATTETSTPSFLAQASPAEAPFALLHRVWEYLAKLESVETDVSVRDDLRIAKLCILEIERGNPDPWSWAFLKYMGIPYSQHLRVIVAREAHEKTLGLTLAEQLKDPTFLASLVVRSSLFQPPEAQMRIDFSQKPVVVQFEIHRV